VATGQVQYTAGAVRPGSSARRLVQAEVLVDGDGTMMVTSGDGTCFETDTKRADQRAFGCGDTVFHFVLDGEMIRGTVTAPVTYWVSGWTRCTRWATDETGRSTCIRSEEQLDEERTARVTANLAVVASG
jgi:hypothetical protein